MPNVINRVDAIVVRAYFRLGQLGKELLCQDFLSLILIYQWQLSEQNVLKLRDKVNGKQIHFLRHLNGLISASLELINQISLPQLGLKMPRGKH
ncbi:hypothetical protein [Aliivibrio salmonicida]|uniref:hypothetical protein n=1 Tax=Aliivibrio salmonicida TaxID=40269 RepID=UPI003D0CE5ED